MRAVIAIMLSDTEILRWYQRLGLPDKTRALIDRIRSSEPVRRVKGSRGNVPGVFPSWKMGRTIQFESHRVALPFVYEYEHDRRDVLEFYDEPDTIKLLFESKSGHRLGVMHIPDYFVIRQGCAGYEECKPEDVLVSRAESSPNMFRRDEDGNWRCPPGEEFAAAYGLYYRVRSSASISETLVRNILYLEEYLTAQCFTVPEDAKEAVQSSVERARDITLRDLMLETEGTARVDDILMMIAAGQVFVDWRAAPLAEPDLVHVHPDRETALAYSRIVRAGPVTAVNRTHAVHIQVNSRVNHDGRVWRIVNPGATKVGLINEDGEYVSLPGAIFEELIRTGEITGVPEDESQTHPQVRKLLASATPKDLETANYRYECVFPERQPEDSGEPDVPERTLRRWKADYRFAEEVYGCGYAGLLPVRDEVGRGRGNYNSKLPEPTRDLIREFILNDYETLKQKKIYEAYVVFKAMCEEGGVVACSYATFVKYVKKRPVYDQTKKRKGRRGAYKFKPFVWYLHRDTPRHGDRPFEIGHMDHTELDVELVCSRTGRNLGRPWMTILTDAYSRKILVVYLTYDSPSRRTCMMVLRDCVRLHGRLPQIVVVDNGPEFHSAYFMALLAGEGKTIKYRPKGEPRSGSVCERLFDTTNTQFVHNLRGNTQLMRNPREATKSVNPKTLAVWTLGPIYEKACEFAYEVYNKMDHPALGQTPDEAFAAGQMRAGERKPARIPYDEHFIMRTLPTTDKGTAKVQPGSGVKINNNYYYADGFCDPDVEGTQVNVRFDPFNAAVAYAAVKGAWVKCVSDHASVFEGRSEREIMLASAELRRRQRLHSRARTSVTAKMLAEFLMSVEAEEVLLLQRLKDRESRGILAKINAGFGAQWGDNYAPGTETFVVPDPAAQESEPPCEAPGEQDDGDRPLRVYGEY